MLSYKAMVARIFSAAGMAPRFVVLPLVLFQWAFRLLRLLPRFHHWSPAMASRMNRDLVFDHTAAAQDFGFAPRAFVLQPGDLPA